MPFEFGKENLESNVNFIQEESTHDSQNTNRTKSHLVRKFVLSANNSDLEEIINNDAKLDKLMAELESIDLPLSKKRLR